MDRRKTLTARVQVKSPTQINLPQTHRLDHPSTLSVRIQDHFPSLSKSMEHDVLAKTRDMKEKKSKKEAQATSNTDRHPPTLPVEHENRSSK